MQLAKEQMSEFERQEAKFRKDELKEREKAFHIPLHVDASY